MDDYSPLVDQATLAAFLDSGGFYAHLRRCRRRYAERQTFFLEQIERRKLPLKFPVTGRGMNLAGMLPEDMNDERLSRRLLAVGLDVPPLSRYAMLPIQPGLLFGLAAFELKQIRDGVGRMARVFGAISR